MPSARTPLDQVGHPLLRKAAEQFADPDNPHERIRAIDDVLLFKVKISRWRGAVFVDERPQRSGTGWSPPACAPARVVAGAAELAAQDRPGIGAGSAIT
ncbi:hypothetical protein I6A84_01150 [Frankia sp. CNm7]|nr:hypothetical protein [Frankia nepalensis]MBL7496136.1 hypothetical protein [Frankia nepalensis]MBL7508925.1 hypothetical protein [Frankia nepalensis]MBL7516765.1 hypothetical protein [Frankia nepalensis]